MAFDKTTLTTTLETIFASMENMTEGNEDVFASGVSNAVVAFVATGQVTTIDNGTVAGGVFSGAGNGSLAVTPASCIGIIKNALTVMKNMTSGGDDYFAEELGKGLKQMADEGTVLTVVNGTLQPPASSPITYAGSAKGSISCQKEMLVTSLKLLFKQMWNRREETGYNGNKEFAKELANGVHKMYTSGSIRTNGLANLTGSVGNGSIS